MASTAALELLVKLSGSKEAADELAALGEKGGGLGDAIKNGAAIAGGAILGLGGILVGATKAAADDNAERARLDQTLKNSIPNWDGNAEAIDKLIASGQNLAFTDSEVRDSLGLLVTRTGDLTEAQALQATAMDLARAKGISLEQATKLVGKADDESYAALAKLGIKVDEHATKEEALAQIRAASAGQAETYANSAAGSMDRVQMAFGEAFETIGGAILPLVEGPLQAFATWVQSPEVQAGIQSVAQGIGEFLAGAFNTISGVVTAVMPTIQNIWNYLTSPEVVANIQGMASAIGEFLGGAFSAIGGIIQGAIPIIQNIWNYLTSPEVVSTITNIATAIGTTLGNAFTAIQSAIETAWPVIQGILETGWTFISQLWTNTWDGISTTLSGVWTAIQGIVEAGWAVVKGIWDTVTSLLKGDWEGAWNSIKTMVEGVWNGIGTFLGGAWTTMQGIWSTFTGTLKTVWDTAWNAISGVATSIWNTITKTIGDAWSAVSSAFKTVSDTVGKTWSDLWGGVGTFVKTTWDTITKTIGDAWTGVQTNLKNIGDGIKKTWDDLWAAVGKTLKDAWDGVTTKFGEFWTFITELPGKMLTEASKIGTNIYNGIVDGVKGLGDALWNFIKGIAESVWNSIMSFFTGGGGESNPPPDPAKKAGGGWVSRNTPYWVGERGPELFVPSGSGSIIPNGRSMSMAGGGGATVYVTINAGMGTGIDEMIEELEYRLGDQIAIRNGSRVRR